MTAPTPPADRATPQRESTLEPGGTPFLLGFVYRMPMWIILGILTIADAYVFWYTLAGLLQRNVELLWIFVTALSLGAVAACHAAGRLMRVDAARRPARIVLVSLILLAWIALGLLITWIRSHDVLYVSREEGALVDAGSGGDSVSSAPIFLATLMLALYVLTGLLTIAHSLHYADPVTQRALLQRIHRRRLRQLTKLRLERDLAEARAIQHETDREREQQYYDAQNERLDAWTHHLDALARLRTAAKLGDPAATDGLFPPTATNGHGPPAPPAPPPPPPAPPAPPPAPPAPPPAPPAPPPAPPAQDPEPPPLIDHHPVRDPDRPTRTGEITWHTG